MKVNVYERTMEGADESVKIMWEDIYRACLEYHGHGGKWGSGDCGVQQDGYNHSIMRGVNK